MNGTRKTWIVFAGVLAASACGKSGENAGAGTPAAAAAFPVADDQQATINGRVAYTGTRRPAVRIDMAEEPSCAAKHPDGQTAETMVVNDNGTLRNVFVYVKSGLPDGMTFPTPTEAVEIDQDGCVYEPHVIAVQVGQTIRIKNSDGLLHNIKATPTANRPFNISQPTNMTTDRTFSAPEVMVPLECNVHSWMKAFAGVTAHPYGAVSNDQGTFSLRRLPPGTYVVEAWQEGMAPQTQTVTVTAGQTQEIVFTFTG